MLRRTKSTTATRVEITEPLPIITAPPAPNASITFKARKTQSLLDKSALFTSTSDDWETPEQTFNTLDAEFHFEVDVCATEHNSKCKVFFRPEIDGLKQEWRGVCWMNPPYGRDIGRWMAKAYTASLEGATVVCLVPARTDTRWWHNFATRGEIRFIQGRLRFGGSNGDAPFPSAIVIFRPNH